MNFCANTISKMPLKIVLTFGVQYKLVDHVITCKDQNYISAEMAEEINEQLLHCIRLIDGLVRYLKSQKNMKK